jgi:hypothetical protein
MKHRHSQYLDLVASRRAEMCGLHRLRIPSRRYDGVERERESERVVACSAALTGFVVEGLADGSLISHYSSNRMRTKGREFTMYNSVSADIAGRGIYTKKAAEFQRARGCTVFWAWRSQARARARQVAIARGCLQASFRNMHGSIRIRKLIASTHGAVIATDNADVAMMCW